MSRPASAAGSRTMAAATSDRPKPARTAGALGEADSGIQVAIQQVHHDVEHDEEDRDHQDRPLHQGVIALHDRVQQKAADAGHREDLLDDDGAAQELADLDAEESDHDDEPVLQNVTPQNDPRSESLRIGSPNEIR